MKRMPVGYWNVVLIHQRRITNPSRLLTKCDQRSADKNFFFDGQYADSLLLVNIETSFLLHVLVSTIAIRGTFRDAAALLDHVGRVCFKDFTFGQAAR